ncbi:alpha-1-macroglobulin-like [Amphibalanus amphitrite]|uniref:alpha-1-macroglobulin-like n=1 Tax=Amphibalanus amphitrite TaxID=1232801 RepID=UPI001C9071ED|nr:alpha-1-macroglobulin-like [Amphibalanus amphitrite]
MTSYITRSLIDLSGTENLLTAQKAVKWIQEQRSTLFFKSPQATAASLEALAAFARRTYSSQGRSEVSVTIGNSHPFYVPVDAHRRLLHQTYRVTNVELPTRVHFEVTEGCVTLKTSLRYASTLKFPAPSFELTAAATERPSNTPGSTFTISTCLAVKPFLNHVDAATVIVNLPSGYVAASASLRAQRYERIIKDFKLPVDAVEVTMKDITQENKCFSFRIVRESIVENLKPAKVHVFDFYEPGHQAQTEYTIQQSSVVSQQSPNLRVY